MLTMIIVFAILTGCFRLLGFSLRILGSVIGWIIGAAIVVSIIGGVFALTGAVIALAFRLLPLVILIGLGIWIGRRMNETSGANYREIINR
ncbi:MAG: hypothetical protein K6G16_05955 [Lachnospiraceae bacterium]|nr:hypothetical protein [Lachnospiraceae bacterium]